MRLVVITGPSGAGKTLVLHSFEDSGYFAADNLPPALLPGLIEFCRIHDHQRAAVVIDARCGSALGELSDVVSELRSQGVPIEVLYLDAEDATLLHRYKETRRPHPLLKAGGSAGIFGAISAERDLLETARGSADRVIDTTSLTASDVRTAIHVAYSDDSRPALLVTVASFGFKHGVPIDADLVFDVRFLANPHYVPELRPLDGRHPEVADFVHADPRTAQFEAKMEDLVRFSLPQYQQEGKAYLNIAIGCTGGRHRSVVLAMDLARAIQEDGYRIAIRHRDVTIGTERQSAESDIRASSEWEASS